MRNTSVFKVFLKYVSLNILGQMAYSCYTLADIFFASASLGTNGLTALNLAFPVFCLLNGTGLMIGMGGGTRYSILKSRGETDGANRIFVNATDGISASCAFQDDRRMVCLSSSGVHCHLDWGDAVYQAGKEGAHAQVRNCGGQFDFD